MIQNLSRILKFVNHLKKLKYDLWLESDQIIDTQKGF